MSNEAGGVMNMTWSFILSAKKILKVGLARSNSSPFIQLCTQNGKQEFYLCGEDWELLASNRGRLESIFNPTEPPPPHTSQLKRGRKKKPTPPTSSTSPEHIRFDGNYFSALTHENGLDFEYSSTWLDTLLDRAPAKFSLCNKEAHELIRLFPQVEKAIELMKHSLNEQQQQQQQQEQATVSFDPKILLQNQNLEELFSFLSNQKP